MRIWNVNPRFLCRVHLIAEHREVHMLAGALYKGVRLDGHVARGLIEPHAVTERHDLLVAEMLARSFRHRTPLAVVQVPYPLPDGYVCEEVSRQELARRCPNCHALQAATPYEFLRPPHTCNVVCAERVRRDLAARPRPQTNSPARIHPLNSAQGRRQ